MKQLIEAIRNAKCVAAMTGAGVSTLCGIPDFRGPQGLYKNPDAERIFDIDWFDRDPSIYYRGCRELVYGLGSFEPGPVHRALKMLEAAGHLNGIITQNIDMLHQKAGSSNVYEVHGSPIRHHCRQCGVGKSFEEIMAMIAANGGTAHLGEPYVPRCRCGGVYKPDITFFGESLPEEAFLRSQELAAPARRQGVHRERATHASRRLRSRLLPRPCRILRLDRLKFGRGLFPVRRVTVDLELERADRAVQLLEICRGLRVEELFGGDIKIRLQLVDLPFGGLDPLLQILHARCILRPLRRPLLT